MAIGEHYVPGDAILAEIREKIIECCSVFGATAASREKTFRTATRPRLLAPGAPTCTGATSGGILTAATYSYRVSAAVEGSETLAGSAGTVTTTGTTSKVTVTWSAIAGATSYKIYGRTAGSEQLLAEVDGTLSWIDTGEAQTSSGQPTADETAQGILQDYKIDVYVGSDVLRITEVMRSDAELSDESLLGESEIDARGRRVGSRYINHGYQGQVAEVIAAQERWRLADRYSWSIVNKGGALYLRLMPSPEESGVVIATRYESTANAISALPDVARPAMELAACEGLLNCILNRVNSDPSFMGNSVSERRDKQEILLLLERQRDRYGEQYRGAVNRRR